MLARTTSPVSTRVILAGAENLILDVQMRLRSQVNASLVMSTFNPLLPWPRTSRPFQEVLVP